MKKRTSKPKNFYDKFYATQKRGSKTEEMKQNIRVNVLRKFKKKTGKDIKKYLLLDVVRRKIYQLQPKEQ